MRGPFVESYRPFSAHPPSPLKQRTMKTARRHELKENDLAHYLEQAVEWSNNNAKLILLGIVGLGAVIAAWVYFQQRSKENAAAAWDQEYAAESSNDTQRLQQFVDANKNTAAGQLANLRLADIAFDEGVGQMSVDREGAEKRLNDAKNRYVEVEAAADDPRIEQRAILGLARYFETIGKLPEAATHYTRLTKFANALFQEEAERKLADLARPQSKDFSEWYSALRPKPQPSATGPLVQSRVDELPGFPAATGGASPSGTSPTGTGPSSTSPVSTSPVSTAAVTPSGTPSATPSGTAAASASPTPTGATSPTATGTSSPTATGTGK
jgi:hypothetical protein